MSALAWLVPTLLLALSGASVFVASGGRGALRIGNAMVRRTLLTMWSYKFQLVSVAAYIVVTALLFWAVGGAFLATLFAPLAAIGGEGLPDNLALFLLLGFAAWPVFWKSWEVTAMSVRREQWEGTFESVVPMPHGVRLLPFGYLYANMGYTLFFQMAVLALVSTALPPGALALATPVMLLNFAGVLVLTILCMWGMGLLFGGLAIMYKAVGPADSVVRTLFLFLSGVFVPLGVLPGWLQTAAHALPLTWSFELMRGVAIDGASLAEQPVALAVLVAFTLVFATAGNLLYTRYVDKARRQGAIQGY